ncbi:unnamed protein product [Notodromas monacha]|uniref:non-specific serine/threonine protein kinase n=1 Tax=Notodromas monacha TaxID=399045 RepID=A0A7R9BJY6_9CRUS|nr:unnamed protein product [Notodromas monacha]CAG0916884.1 unnamed protein product [Notodromas monacha]
MSFKCPSGFPVVDISHSPPAGTFCRSQRTPDIDVRSGDEAHEANLRRYLVNKRSLTNSYQSGQRSTCNSGNSSSRCVLAGEKRNNDGAVIRVPASSGRPSGGYLSPCGLENVSFCSASTESSNTQKSGTQSGTQSGYRSNSKNECSKTESKMQAKEDVTPEKRRRLEEKQECCDCVTAGLPAVLRRRNRRTNTRTPHSGAGALTRSRRLCLCYRLSVQCFFAATTMQRSAKEPNPFSLLLPPSSDKLLLSGQSVARCSRSRRLRDVPRSCVSFDVNTTGRALLLKNGLDTSRKLHVLGRGGFGVVVKAVYQGQAVAVKIIPRHNKSQRTVESCLRAEMNAINLDHPNIVRAIRIFGFEERNALVIMELAGSISLQTMLNDHRTDIPFVTRVKFAVQIACALEFCHDRRILHLDVKPSNILISGHETCKLGDFGCSRHLDDAMTQGNNSNCPVRGTVVYQAPEVLRGCLPTERADVYSLGITMWQMITREYPFPGERSHVVMYLVGGRGKRPVMPHPGNQNEKFYMTLVEHCWKQNPILRPSAAEIQLEMRSWTDSVGEPLIV